jgi:hypothetical protein
MVRNCSSKRNNLIANKDGRGQGAIVQMCDADNIGIVGEEHIPSF